MEPGNAARNSRCIRNPKGVLTRQLGRTRKGQAYHLVIEHARQVTALQDHAAEACLRRSFLTRRAD